MGEVESREEGSLRAIVAEFLGTTGSWFGKIFGKRFVSSAAYIILTVLVERCEESGRHDASLQEALHLGDFFDAIRSARQNAAGTAMRHMRRSTVETAQELRSGRTCWHLRPLSPAPRYFNQ
jgi:hypothetical protein